MTILELLELLGSALMWGVGIFVMSGALGALAGRCLARWRALPHETPVPPMARHPRPRRHWRAPRRSRVSPRA
jgi:hypothetical protein